MTDKSRTSRRWLAECSWCTAYSVHHVSITMDKSAVKAVVLWPSGVADTIDFPPSAYLMENQELATLSTAKSVTMRNGWSYWISKGCFESNPVVMNGKVKLFLMKMCPVWKIGFLNNWWIVRKRLAMDDFLTKNWIE